ncbi:DoxX family protein [Kribbella monticola]|uniref:DoxX family protein n=1 Tax=Kribbella monticola TaxID=2185285 RepID=UPI000DD2D702|nr:DoxX family protein [Kribbella monticola]
MYVAYAVVVTVTALANLAMVVADLARADFVLSNMCELGLNPAHLTPLAALKTAGSAGLLLGFAHLYPIAIPAAIGLVAFFTGAVITHLRARVLYNLAFPLTYLALATASLTLTLLHANSQ